MAVAEIMRGWVLMFCIKVQIIIMKLLKWNFIKIYIKVNQRLIITTQWVVIISLWLTLM